METRPADLPPLLTRLWSAGADLLWGSSCVGCDVGGAGMCRRCAEDLDVGVGVRTLASDTGCYVHIFSAAPYAGAVARALPVFKERGRTDLLRPLARGLACGIAAAAMEAPEEFAPVWLIPVPQTRQARGRRGASPVLRLSRAAARTLRAAGRDVRIAENVLTHVRKVGDQAELDRAGRLENLRGAIAVRPGPMTDAVAALAASGAPVVLVDDIVTTGSTLAECHRALFAAGIEVRLGAVVADTPLSH